MSLMAKSINFVCHGYVDSDLCTIQRLFEHCKHFIHNGMFQGIARRIWGRELPVARACHIERVVWRGGGNTTFTRLTQKNQTMMTCHRWLSFKISRNVFLRPGGYKFGKSVRRWQFYFSITFSAMQQKCFTTYLCGFDERIRKRSNSNWRGAIQLMRSPED